MKITSVSFLADDEEAIRLDLRNVATVTPYAVRAIVGLDADEIIPKFYGFSTTGKKFYDFSLKPRDLVFRIVLNPRYKIDENVSYLRDTLYRAISSTRTGLLEVQFHAGSSTEARTFGFITKFEVPHFNKTPEVQITIRCNDPMLRSLNPILMTADDLPSVNPIVLADNLSTAPHGMSFAVTFTATTAEFTIQDKVSSPEWKFQIIPQTSFLSGDQLYFSSEFKNKYLYRIRSGVTTHMMDAITTSSIWPIIFPGFNELYFNQIASIDWIQIEYYRSYWGV